MTAKAYRLLKAIMETAVDDELDTRKSLAASRCRQEKTAERRIATVTQVNAPANAVGMQWRLMIYLGAYGPLKRRTRMFAFRAESFPARQSGSRCSFAVIVTSASLSKTP
ncbi:MULTISPECIES: hypothetical protein [unclassified Streptomyces]|jgi:hypothetical protein|uniref:hypothetical protein n=1 Tax=unclassified Streptomyces TaxID=2593676 RepID=UPI00071081A8|nr:hypothetical protein ASD08_21785 [Streptomyces sp. Root369]